METNRQVMIAMISCALILSAEVCMAPSTRSHTSGASYREASSAEEPRVALSGLAFAPRDASLRTSLLDVPPARSLPSSPEVREDFESEPVGQQPANWILVNSVGGIIYDANWQVFELGPPYGKVVSATKAYNSAGTQAVSHLAYHGTTGRILNGSIPKDAHYYVETLLHMREPVAYWANEHTLQGIVQDDYNLEVLIWSNNNGTDWGLRLFSNGGESILADWGLPGRGITVNTGQTGWNWWARVGLDIDLGTQAVSVYYNGQEVIPPLVVQSIGTKALASGKDIRADVRTTNNLMDADDFRIYLIGPTSLLESPWGSFKMHYR